MHHILLTEVGETAQIFNILTSGEDVSPDVTSEMFCSFFLMLLTCIVETVERISEVF